MTDVSAPGSTCHACGATIVADDRFCARCGTSLDTAMAEQSSQSEPGLFVGRRRVGGSDWQPKAATEASELDEIQFTTSVPAPSRRKKRRPRRRSRLLNVLIPLSVAIAIVVSGLAARGLSETSFTIDKLQHVSTPPAQITDQTVQNSGALAGTDQTANQQTALESTGPSSEDIAQLPAIPDTDRSTWSQASESAQEDIESIPAPDDPVPNQPDSTSENTEGDAPGSSEPQKSTGADFDGASSNPPVDGEAQAEQLLAGGMAFDTAPAIQAIAEAQHAGLYEASESDDPPGSSASSNPPSQSEGDGLAAPQPVTDSQEQAAVDDGGGIFGSIRDAGSELKDTAQGAAIAAGIADPDSRPLTILVLGVDAREGSAIDIGVRPDALMVLRLDPQAGTCKGLAIPRDSLVELPGYGETKINHALMLGGIPYQQLVVENYLGLEIDHYALIDFTGFAELVGSVGGVSIDVPPELASPAVSAGTVTIDGDQALQHARYRGSGEGDFDRIRRQQQIMRGLIDAAEGRDLLSEATRLLISLSDHVRTDMDIDQLVSLARLYQDRCTADGLQMSQIDGDVVYGPIIDPLFNLPLSYVVSDSEVVREEVVWLLDD
jgi:LCP family protein required for cell wall assembly